MDSISRTDLLHNILKPSFPRAENIEILEIKEAGHDFQFTSSLEQVTIRYDQKGERHEKHLVIKISHDDASYVQCFVKMNFYSREIFMYKILIPEIRNFLDDPILPICYHAIHTNDSTILVLENILVQGYETGRRRQLLNCQQSFPVLEALAQFHAASHKVCQSTRSLLNDLLFETSILIEFKEMVVDLWGPALCKLLRMKNAAHLLQNVRAAIEYLRQNELSTKLSHSNFKFNVLNHGDFRTTNLMFKFNSQDRRVEGIKFVDFQTCKWTSPALDLIYFFTSSVRADVIEDQFETLVNWYLQCLKAKLVKLNCSNTYNKQNFEADFQSLAYFLFLCALYVGPLVSPLDREEQERVHLLDEKGREDLYQRCLDDANWVDTMYRWMKFCDKLNIFNTLLAKPT